MANKKYKPQIPDIMEAIFDAGYLIFDLIAGILFFAFSKGDPLFILYGVLTLTLCGGDAFHLVPRIIRAVHGSNDKIKRQLGLGLQVSSITMTAFYIVLLYIWKLTFPELTAPVAVEAMIWISAIIRMVICVLPQNNWCSDEGNMKLSVIRNTVFAVTGIGVIILYAISGNTIYDCKKLFDVCIYLQKSFAFAGKRWVHNYLKAVYRWRAKEQSIHGQQDLMHRALGFIGKEYERL